MRPLSISASEGRRFPKGRCLIPASHFFEFTGRKSPKSKWKFTKGRRGLVLLCRLVAADAGEGEAFMLLTTEPRAPTWSNRCDDYCATAPAFVTRRRSSPVRSSSAILSRTSRRERHRKSAINSIDRLSLISFARSNRSISDQSFPVFTFGRSSSSDFAMPACSYLRIGDLPRWNLAARLSARTCSTSVRVSCRSNRELLQLRSARSRSSVNSANNLEISGDNTEVLLPARQALKRDGACSVPDLGQIPPCGPTLSFGGCVGG